MPIAGRAKERVGNRPTGPTTSVSNSPNGRSRTADDSARSSRLGHRDHPLDRLGRAVGLGRARKLLGKRQHTACVRSDTAKTGARLLGHLVCIASDSQRTLPSAPSVSRRSKWHCARPSRSLRRELAASSAANLATSLQSATPQRTWSDTRRRAAAYPRSARRACCPRAGRKPTPSHRAPRRASPTPAHGRRGPGCSCRRQRGPDEVGTQVCPQEELRR